jgi:uncharacterized protein YbcV (DUF1398 family)
MNSVETILQEADQNKWSYQKKFEALKNAGVVSQTVQFIGAYDSAYEGTFGVWHEPVPADYTSPQLSDCFFEDGIKAALVSRMQGKTSYNQFLADIAASGVSHYRKEFTNSDNTNKYKITYFNANEDQSYQQIVE